MCQIHSWSQPAQALEGPYLIRVAGRECWDRRVNEGYADCNGLDILLILWAPRESQNSCSLVDYGRSDHAMDPGRDARDLAAANLKSISIWYDVAQDRSKWRAVVGMDRSETTTKKALLMQPAELKLCVCLHVCVSVCVAYVECFCVRVRCEKRQSYLHIMYNIDETQP